MSDMPLLLESPEFSSFCIFAPELGSDDEEASLLERSQELLYFFPDGMPVEDKLFHVGTCKTALNIMRDFGPSQGGVPARTATICLARRRISLREVEPGVWAALVVVAGTFDSRPPVDGQEMGAAVAMQASTPHMPHLAPTGDRTSAADFHHVTSEGDAQSLIDTVYRRARMLVGGVWGGLGGEPGYGMLAAVKELARQQRRCLSKAGRAAEREAASPARDTADGHASADEACLLRRARAAQAAWDAATAASPLRLLRQRLRRAVTWCLWCVDARRWSVVDARDGPTPCPVDRTAMPLVVQATEALRGCFLGVDSVTLLWQGSVVVRAEAAARYGCVRGFVGFPAATPLPVLAAVRSGWLEGLPSSLETAQSCLRSLGSGDKALPPAAPAPSGGLPATDGQADAAAAGGEDVAPSSGSHAVESDSAGAASLGPAVAALGVAGGEWADTLESTPRASAERVLARSPRLLALPVCLSSSGSPVNTHRVLWAQRGRLSALIHVREGACDWSPAPRTVLPSASVLELCQRVVSTLTALEEPLAAALDLGVRAAERRSLTDSLVQRHVDEGSVGVFGALRAAPTASGGVGSDDAVKCVSAHARAILSRASEAAGWRIPPPVAGEHSAWESPLNPAPSAQADSPKDGRTSDGSTSPCGPFGPIAQTQLQRDADAAALERLARAEDLSSSADDAKAAAAAGAAAAAAAASAAGGSPPAGGLPVSPSGTPPSAESRLLNWAVRSRQWSAVCAAHWDVTGGGGAGGGAADVPANYNSPGELERATLRISAAPDNAVSTARPSERAIRATVPTRFSRFERMEMTRYHGGAVVRSEGFREVLLVHSTVTPTHVKATQRAKDLLGPRFRNLYV